VIYKSIKYFCAFYVTKILITKFAFGNICLCLIKHIAKYDFVCVRVKNYTFIYIYIYIYDDINYDMIK